MRVLHILNTNSYSGAENVVINIIKETSQFGVDSAYLSPSGPIDRLLKKKEITKIPCSSNKVTIQDIKKAIREYKPDIIHAHDFTAGICSVLTHTRIPIINHIHNNVPWLKTVNFKSFLYRVISRKINYVLFVSDSIPKEYIFLKSSSFKYEVIGNPFDAEFFPNQVENETKTIDVVFLGRLTQQKQPLYFLELIHKISHIYPTIRTVLVGDGPEKEECKKYIIKNDLSQYVTLTGFIPDPYRILNQSKLLCMPSKWEGFGLAALEAMSLGLPVVGAPVGGLKDIINDNSGILCNSTDEYINAIIKILDDKDEYIRLSKGAIERSKEFSNMEDYCINLKKIYDRLIGYKK